jgi:hypothetical protein
MDSSNNVHNQTLQAIVDPHKNSLLMVVDFKLNREGTPLHQTHNVDLHHLVSVA